MKSFGMDYQGRLSPFEKGEYPDRGEGLEKNPNNQKNHFFLIQNSGYNSTDWLVNEIEPQTGKNNLCQK